MPTLLHYRGEKRERELGKKQSNYNAWNDERRGMNRERFTRWKAVVEKKLLAKRRILELRRLRLQDEWRKMGFRGEMREHIRDIGMTDMEIIHQYELEIRKEDMKEADEYTDEDQETREKEWFRRALERRKRDLELEKEKLDQEGLRWEVVILILGRGRRKANGNTGPGSLTPVWIRGIGDAQRLGAGIQFPKPADLRITLEYYYHLASLGYAHTAISTTLGILYQQSTALTSPTTCMSQLYSILRSEQWFRVIAWHQVYPIARVTGTTRIPIISSTCFVGVVVWSPCIAQRKHPHWGPRHNDIVIANGMNSRADIPTDTFRFDKIASLGLHGELIAVLEKPNLECRFITAIAVQRQLIRHYSVKPQYFAGFMCLSEDAGTDRRLRLMYWAYSHGLKRQRPHFETTEILGYLYVGVRVPFHMVAGCMSRGSQEGCDDSGAVLSHKKALFRRMAIDCELNEVLEADTDEMMESSQQEKSSLPAALHGVANLRTRYKECSLIAMNWLRRKLRPKLKAGYRRIEWQCDCGVQLYADFEGGSSATIDDLQQSLQSTASSNGTTGQAGKTTDRGTSDGQISAGTSPPSTTKQSESSVSTSTPGTCTRLKFLALCVNTGGIYKTLAEIDSTAITSDAAIFLEMKKSYLQTRGVLSRLTFLVKPVTIEFVQFTLWHLRNGYISICNRPDRIPPRDRIDYEYIPKPLDPPLPMPPETFIHYLEHGEGDLNPTRSNWVNRLPKRLDERVVEGDEGTYGWGIHIIEGPNKVVIFWIIIVTVLATIVASSLWAALNNDMQGGTGLGTLMAAMPPIILTAFLFRMGVA